MSNHPHGPSDAAMDLAYKVKRPCPHSMTRCACVRSLAIHLEAVAREAVRLAADYYEDADSADGLRWGDIVPQALRAATGGK